MREPAGKLADGFHFLRLAQRLFDLAEAFLIGHAAGDVIGELICADLLPRCVAQRGEANFVMPATVFVITKCHGNIDEFLTIKGALPVRPQTFANLGEVVKLIEHRSADLGPNSVSSLEIVAGRAIDGDPAEFQVGDQQVRVPVIDQISPPAALGFCGE